MNDCLCPAFTDVAKRSEPAAVLWEGQFKSTMRRLGIPYGVPVFWETQKIKNIKYQMNDRLVPPYRCGETQ